MNEFDIDYLRTWIGRTERRQEQLCPERAVALAAALDHDAAPASGDVLPPLWHWAYFLPNARQSELGADGHPRLGGFMPPVPLPRRMWVGGRLKLVAPLRLGLEAERRTEIIDITAKSGKSGALVFLTLRHEISTSGMVAIVEEQDLVYRPADGSGQAAAVEEPPETEFVAKWREHLVPDPTLLFRYSAITFNAHRIHYDERYAVEEEGYPGLVVHGPLTATLLLDRLIRNTGRNVSEFSFRAVRPLFCGRDMRLCGKPLEGQAYEIWAETSTGNAAMKAKAILT